MFTLKCLQEDAGTIVTIACCFSTLYSIFYNKQEVVVIMILSSRREDATPADGKILSFSVVSDTVHGMV